MVLDPASTAATIADGVGEVSILDRDEPRLPATERVNVRSDGSQVQPIGFGQLAISEDGRFVAFFSGSAGPGAGRHQPLG